MQSMTNPAHALSAPHFPPATWPFTREDFRRVDEAPDPQFYITPRIGVFHIDHLAVRALTRFYETHLPPNANILDLCSSWVSHIPDSYSPASLTVLGLSREELQANVRAGRVVVQDLNVRPRLPFPDCSFEVVTNVVSVDYLTRPLEVFREICRVLKPGGRAFMAFSNRCFPTKVVQIWGQTSDAEHVYIVGCYFHFAGGFHHPIVHDLRPGLFGLSDPMYVVEAVKE